MTEERCSHAATEVLTDYLTGGLTPDEEAAFEAHLFMCEDCTRVLDERRRLVNGIRLAARADFAGGLVTDAMLNRWAREGVRIRTYALSPGDVVPCAIWDGDDVMVARLRGDFARLSNLTLVQRMGEQEPRVLTGIPVAAEAGEIIYAAPAAPLRELPSLDVELTIRAGAPDAERTIGTYTLRHSAGPHHP